MPVLYCTLGKIHLVRVSFFHALFIKDHACIFVVINVFGLSLCSVLDQELFCMDPERDPCVRNSRAIGSNLTALLYGSDSESFKTNTGTGNFLKFFWN